MKYKIFLSLFFVMIFIALGYFFYSKEEIYTIPTNEELFQLTEYAGSVSCKECHEKEYEDWKSSYHFKAMEVADEKSILGDFNDARYTADGITTRFFKKNNKFYIETENERGILQEFEVLYTFGAYPLQQYLTAFEGGRMQVFRQSWDSREKKWFHQYSSMHIPHTDWLHWTGNAQNWNLMCASCHTTNYQKKYDAVTDTYQTTYAEHSVGCESCHNAGKKHIEYVKQKGFQKGKSPHSYMMKLHQFTQKQELAQCMPCHSRRGETSQTHAYSPEVLDNYIPEIISTENYFADGQAKEEVYKYGSFLQSKMHRMGVKCSDCHNPHTTKLKYEGDKVCMQCHDSGKYKTKSHSFHNEGSIASDCRSCHMPTRTYMGNDIRHDHTFSVPRPDLSATYGVPNACNDCHKDKNAKWASNYVKKWYGDKRRSHFSEDLILASQSENENRITSIHNLLLNTETPAIIKATSLHYLSEIADEESFTLLQKELTNSEAIIRYRAIMGLMHFPIYSCKEKIILTLSDSVKAVRIASANLLLTQLGIEECHSIPAFAKAHEELKDFLLSQADFAVGSSLLAEYYAKIGEDKNAILYYERALKKDNKLNFVRINLAMLYNKAYQNEKSLQILTEAYALEPQNEQISYYLALLYSEINDFKQAKRYIEQAMKLGMSGEAIQRNYNEILKMTGS